MEKNLKIYNLLKEVPKEAQKKIQGGRLKGMTDIKPMWRIEKLTEVFGPVGLGWYAPIKNKEIIDGAKGVKVAIVDINLFVNYKKPLGLAEDSWSEAIDGTGGSTLVSIEKDDLYTSDECFKMAYTDALSVACKSLGMGANVYWGDSKHESPEEITTKEQAEKYKLNFGKYTGKTLKEILDEDESYIDWLFNNEKTDDIIKKAISMLDETIGLSDKEKIRMQPINEGQKQMLLQHDNNVIKSHLMKCKKPKISDLTWGEAEDFFEEHRKNEKEVF